MKNNNTTTRTPNDRQDSRPICVLKTYLLFLAMFLGTVSMVRMFSAIDDMVKVGEMKEPHGKALRIFICN